MRLHKTAIILFLLIHTLWVYGFSTSDSLYRVSCDGLHIPILYIATENGEMPTCTIVYAPEGCSGRSITDATKLPAHMWVVLDGDTIYDTGNYIKNTTGLTIKVRGNTTASDKSEKKPYKLKLQKKADLLFRGNDAVYADKEWVLLRNEWCETIVGNMTNRLIGMEWVPAQTPVLLFLNENFRGVYMLTENVKRNAKCRVDITDQGFLFEYDAYWWNEDYHIDSPRFGHRINYTLKYPDPKKILPWQEEYLTAHIAQVENAFFVPNGLDSVIDINSYVRWLWVHDLLGNRDGGGSNIYFSKYDTTANSKQKMLCAWDFSGCFTPNIQWSEIHNHAWFYRFFQLPQTQFVQSYIHFYDSTIGKLLDTLILDIHRLRQTEQFAQLDSALVLDNQRWGTNNQANVRLQEIADFLTNRKVTVENMMMELKAQYPEEATAYSTQKDQTAPILLYDIFGHALQHKQNGLNIIRYTDGTVKKEFIP